MNKFNYCANCDHDTEYEIKMMPINLTIKEIEIQFEGEVAFCTECGEEMNINELDKKLITTANDIYRQKAGLVTIDDIKNLLNKYELSKRDLSRLLGWGEITVTRYINTGITPNKEYSDRLKSLENPNSLLQLIKSNGHVLTDSTREALIAKVKTLLGYNQESPEITYRIVADYFLSKIDPEAGTSITNLKLQKLVYYAQSWSLAYHNKTMFNSRLEAWVHGPVIAELYQQYKDCGYCCIQPVDDFDETLLVEQEKSILDMVWKVYGKYDAKCLERLTHEEDPWMIARKGLAITERSTMPISTEVMRTFYQSIIKDHQIETTHDLNKYVASKTANL